MTLYDFLKQEDTDFDSYDTVFDIEVTVCVPYHSEDSNYEYYDKFCDFILKCISGVEKISDCECRANWYSFVAINLEVFKEIANDMWREGSIPDDDDDLIYEWIEEINGWIAGGVSENEYKHFMETYASRIKEDN